MLFVSPDPASSKFGYFPDMTFEGGGEYHAFDINMFYRDIRANAMERVLSFAKETVSDSAIGESWWSGAEASAVACPQCVDNAGCVILIVFSRINQAL